MRTSRRSFLKAGLAFLAGAGLGGCSGRRDSGVETSGVEAMIKSFPEEIPGASRVVKYPVKGAKTCVVHIRQEHLVGFNPNSYVDGAHGFHINSQEELERVNYYQEQIYKILKYLKDKEITSSVYIEGMTPEIWDRINREGLLEKILYPINEELEDKLCDFEQKLSQEIIWDVPKGSSADEVRKGYLNRKNQLEKEYEAFREKYKFAGGGALRLVYGGELSIAGFEDANVLDSAYRELDETGRVGKIGLDGREDSLLESIGKSGEEFAFVVLGGQHAFGGKKSCGLDYSLKGRMSYKDNLYEWNRNNPDNNLALIEITPERYEEF